MYKWTLIVAMLMNLSACNGDSQMIDSSKENLGKEMFNDISLSRDGTQSCASCHNSQHAFSDPRVNLTSIDGLTPGAVSIAQDNALFGDINTPSIAYAAFIPNFHFDSSEQLYKGGFFLDGRATDLVEQAKHPFLDPVEMQNTKEGVVSTVELKYGNKTKAIYGDEIFNDTDMAYDAIADAIASFEKTEELSPFDSRFDKFLIGEATLSESEQRGLELFRAEDKANCAACHPVPEVSSSKKNSLFTDFTYDNLGVPKNTLVRTANEKGMHFINNGLFNNPLVSNPDLKGAFRVSSLRNIAVTPPYMHNGVFKSLETVLHFYNSRDVDGAINPETGLPWKPAEVNGTKNTEELGDLNLTDEDISHIVAFLKTLTDSKYEYLLDK